VTVTLLFLGTGVKPGAKVKSCGTCGGQGAVNNVQRTPFGVFSNVQPCPKCGGSGEEVEEHCGACRGQGQVAETKEVTLKIPAGVESGSTMRLRDGGNAGETALLSMCGALRMPVVLSIVLSSNAGWIILRIFQSLRCVYWRQSLVLPLLYQC
jgi:DnaJ-class molecular chaperone